MKCSEFLHELTGYLDGVLDEKTKVELENHLSWCHNCYVVCDTTKKTIEIYLFGLNPVFSFWFAYVMTRPLGASFADWFGKSKSITGLGYGDGIVAGVLIVLIVIFVGYLTVSKRDVQREGVRRGYRNEFGRS